MEQSWADVALEVLQGMGIGTTGSVDTLDGIGFLAGGEPVDKMSHCLPRTYQASDTNEASDTYCACGSCTSIAAQRIQFYVRTVVPREHSSFMHTHQEVTVTREPLLSLIRGSTDLSRCG